MGRHSWSELLLLLILLAGCGSSPVPTAAVAYPDLTGNWQIQSTNVSAAGPAAQVVLLGALRNSTTTADVSGTFRFSDLAQPLGCALNQVVSLSGTVDSGGNLSLSSPTSASGSTIKTQLHPSATPNPIENGTIEIDGTSCALASSSAIGVEIAPLNGTFDGQLIAGAIGSGASVAGTASLILSQSSTPGTDGQFPLTGSLSYVLGTCSGTIALSGNASGVGLLLAAVTATPLTLPAASILGTTDAAADKVDLVSAVFSSLSCTGTPPALAVYSGTLNRQ